MAKYRPVFTKIWDDPDFQECSPSCKLIFVFLCTNTLTTESGIYPVSYKSVAQGTGINVSVVKKALLGNMIKNISYDDKNRVVFVRNFLRYNGRGRKDLVIKSILNDYRYIHTRLWSEFKERYPRYFEEMERLSKELDKTSIPNPSPNPMSNPKTKPTLTPHTCESAIVDRNEDIPIEEMRAIFLEYWQEYNEGRYLPDEVAERPVAIDLYKWCLEEDPDDPLSVFSTRVERLVLYHGVKHFSGLLKWWNAGATDEIA